MKVLVIDDEPLARNELRFLLRGVVEDIEISEAATIEEALNQLLIEEPELLFLDIHLTNESGLTLAEKIKRMPHPPLIVFATAYDDYAAKAFELDVQDYLLKPFELERVRSVLDKAMKVLKGRAPVAEPIANEVEEYRLPIKTNERIYLLPPSEILSVSVVKGLTEVVVENHCYQTCEPLNHLIDKLPAQRFIRVHRSYVINVFEVSEIQPWFNQTLQVTMSNGDKIPVSRSYLTQFKERVGLN